MKINHAALETKFVQQFELQADVSGEGPFTTSHHDLTAPAWLRREHRVALVWTVSLSNLGLVGLLTWQALRGQPVVAPDAWTLGALCAVLLTAGVTASVVMLRALSGRK